MPNTYAILGTGALGGLYGGRLHSIGKEVHFLCRSDFRSIEESGLQIQSPWGDLNLQDVRAYDSASAMPKVDVAIVAWKATANDALSSVLPHVCGPETCVLVLQNGLDMEADSAAIVGENRVLGGCCFLCCNKTGPGKIHHLDYGKIAFGEYSPEYRGQTTLRMQEIASDLEAAGVPVLQSRDLALTRWRKLMWNIPFNGLSVALDADTSQIMTAPDSAELAHLVMEDVRLAAQACGVHIEPEFLHKLLEDTRRMVPYASSMLLDYRHKRQIEVEAILGNAVRKSTAAGFVPKYIGSLYKQLRFLDERNRAPDSPPS